AGADKIFEGVKTGGAAFGKGAKITSESKIEIEGYPGREWTLDIPGQGSMKWRAFLVKNRLYQLIAGGDPKKASSKDVHAFFDSFQPQTEKLTWKDFTSKEGRFTVRLPRGSVAERHDEVKSRAGKLIIHDYRVELPEKLGRFIISITDYPDGTISAEHATNMLASGKKSHVAGAKIINESEIKVEGHPGWEATFDTSEGRTKIRFFIVKDRTYQIMVRDDEKKLSEKDMQPFFDSFKLTGK